MHQILKYSFNKWVHAGLRLEKKDFNKDMFLKLTESFRTDIVTTTSEGCLWNNFLGSQSMHNEWLRII